MSLCRLMCLDFMDSVGRKDERGRVRYGRYDLNFGYEYADDLIQSGFNTEPFYGFNLRVFKQWCKEKLS